MVAEQGTITIDTALAAAVVLAASAFFVWALASLSRTKEPPKPERRTKKAKKVE